MTKVSIAMATFNGSLHLGDQLRSFAAQGRAPNELVVCDDGSTDDTVAMLHAFAASAPFEVRIVVNPERLGYNANFAKAIGLSAGDVVFVSDQDDIWYPEKLAAVLDVFAGQPSALLVTNDQMITDGSARPTGVTVLQNVRRLGSPDAWFGPGCCSALRRRALPLLTPFPDRIVPYDHWITTLPDLLGARILLERPLQAYRRHETNTSGSVFADARASIWHLASAAHRQAQRAAFAGQIAMIEAMETRLTERGANIEALGLADQLPTALLRLREERLAYAGRLAALGKGRLQRLPAVIRLLREGRYRSFHGYKSAAKDLIT